MVRDKITFTNAQGETYVLCDYSNNLVDNFVPKGSQGLDMPTFTYNTVQIPEMAGVELVNINVNKRDISIPFQPVRNSYKSLMQERDYLASILSPTIGDGVLRFERPSWTREVTCRYMSGLESVEVYGSSSFKTVLMFTALDPYFYPITPVEYEFTLSEDGENFFPILPMRLADSNLFNQPIIANSGDADAFPVWTITGHGEEVRIYNVTTGKKLSLTTYEIETGDVVTIDCRRGHKSIYLNGDEESSLFPYRSDDSFFFPLERGRNEVRIEMNGAGETSKVNVSFYPPYNKG